MISAHAENISRGFAEYEHAQYSLGVSEGRAGQPYTGKTWIGYYGWLDGSDECNHCGQPR